MLECELCNYLQNVVKGSLISKCEFTGHVFIGRQGFDLSEYPCASRSLTEYLLRRKMSVQEPREDNKQVYPLNGDSWRFVYLKVHPGVRMTNVGV